MYKFYTLNKEKTIDHNLFEKNAKQEDEYGQTQFFNTRKFDPEDLKNSTIPELFNKVSDKKLKNRRIYLCNCGIYYNTISNKNSIE